MAHSGMYCQNLGGSAAAAAATAAAAAGIVIAIAAAIAAAVAWTTPHIQTTADTITKCNFRPCHGLNIK